MREAFILIFVTKTSRWWERVVEADWLSVQLAATRLPELVNAIFFAKSSEKGRNLTDSPLTGLSLHILVMLILLLICTFCQTD